MAALTVLKPNAGTAGAEDDEAWLYGDSENGENKEPEPAPPGTIQTPITEEARGAGEDASQTQDKYDDDDSDDDDDDVQVTIGDIKAFPMNNASTGLYKPPGTYQKQPVVSVGQKITTTTPGVKGVDVDAEGTINGVGVYEFSLDSLQEEEKPWRKPGADITDYFNYGFNEDTWRKYCQKQNRLRGDNGAAIPRSYSMGTSNTVVKMESVHTGYMSQPRVLQPKPIQSVVHTGTIAVLGSTTASRRPVEEQTNDPMGQVPDDINKTLPPPGMPPPGMNMPPPDYSVPPPGMPTGMPQMPHSFPQAVPPPRMPIPPPGMFAQPPPVPYFPQHVPVVNQPNYGERPPFSYDNTQQYPSYPTYTADAKPKWESSREDDRYSRSSRGDNSSTSRDYDRGDYYRSRDSDRTRSDRERSRSRDRDRKHRDRDRDRDRDEKKSKSRKVKDEPDDSDYYKSSSKHKKSKRSKRDKDDDRPTSGDDDK